MGGAGWGMGVRGVWGMGYWGQGLGVGVSVARGNKCMDG